MVEHFCIRLYVSLILVWVAISVESPGQTNWKDSWLLKFERDAHRTGQAQLHLCDNSQSTSCLYRVPKYLPARLAMNYSQTIPKAIFQTWKSYSAAGEHHHRAIMSFIYDNPEYEYYLFDDTAASIFMRRFFPEVFRLYDKVIPGAMRADLWRLAVIYKYGGVYFDTDAASVVPLKSFIWRNASVVTGIGASRDFHQWALLYAPRHPIILRCLHEATERLKLVYEGYANGAVAQTTGPVAFHAGVKAALTAADCPFRFTPEMRLQFNPRTTLQYLPNHNCGKDIGVLQIFAGDFLGHNVLFKAAGVDDEKNTVSAHYSIAQRRYSSLFKTEGRGVGKK